MLRMNVSNTLQYFLNYKSSLENIIKEIDYYKDRLLDFI